MMQVEDHLEVSSSCGMRRAGAFGILLACCRIRANRITKAFVAIGAAVTVLSLAMGQGDWLGEYSLVGTGEFDTNCSSTKVFKRLRDVVW